MKILERLFSKRQSQKGTTNVMRIAGAIGPLIEEAVRDVFASYRPVLLSEPITYIVPTVWGAKKDGDLTDIQKEIHARINPVIEKVFHSLEMRDLDCNQEFALYFLVRGIMISKLVYMIEAFKGRMNERTIEEQNMKEALMQYKPVGRA